MALVRYRNKNNHAQIEDRLEPDPDLEARGNWERVYVEGVDAVAEAAAEAALRRAEAETRSIVEANATREDEAALRAEQAAEISRRSASAPPVLVSPNVTPYHTFEQQPSLGAVLSRPGDNRGLTDTELQAMEAADSAAIHAMGPEGAVLGRLGPKPSDYPATSELEAQVAADAERIHASGVGVLHPDHPVGGNAPRPTVVSPEGVEDTEQDLAEDDEDEELDEDEDTEEGEEVQRPGKGAHKADWVAYVVAVTDMSEEEAQQLSIPKLMALVPEDE